MCSKMQSLCGGGKKKKQVYQKVIIPKGMVNPAETTIIEIPVKLQKQPVVVAKRKPSKYYGDEDEDGGYGQAHCEPACAQRPMTAPPPPQPQQYTSPQLPPPPQQYIPPPPPLPPPPQPVASRQSSYRGMCQPQPVYQAPQNYAAPTASASMRHNMNGAPPSNSN